MSLTVKETSVINLVELERCALNEALAASGLDWFWDSDTHASLRCIGGVKRQLDEYGCRMGELLNYEQLVELHDDVVRRMESRILSRISKQVDRAWVA